MRRNVLKGISLVLSTTLLAGMLAGCGAAEEKTTAYEEGGVATEEPAESASDSGRYEVAEEAPEMEYVENESSAYDDLYEWNDSADRGLQSEKMMDEVNGSYLYPDYYEPVNSEEYEKAEENGFCITAVEPLSTFSADVDTASYSNVRRMIEDGYSSDMIDPAAVRP